MMVYGVDLTAGGDVRGGCLQRRFRMDEEMTDLLGFLGRNGAT